MLAIILPQFKFGIGLWSTYMTLSIDIDKIIMIMRFFKKEINKMRIAGTSS